MTTYADPTRCPDCHAMLPRDPAVCRVCSLPLTGPAVVSLFSTLQEADRLLGILRAQKRAVPSLVGAAPAAGSFLDEVAPYPAPGTRAPVEGPRLRGSSVPRVLLTLGALCLLVAAVAFLAVAWNWLGVGGRTVVLVGLTGSALGLAAELHRRDLRTAAEALCVVGLGMLALDVTGLRAAGWLGQADDARLTLMTGAAVAAAALVVLVASARRPLVSPALIAPVALLVAGVGAQGDHESPVALLTVTLLLLGLGRIGTVLPSTPLTATSIAAAVPAWLYVGAAGVDLAGDPVTLAHYAGELACWPLLAATVAAALVGPVTGVRREVAHTGYAVAALVGSYTALLPVLDNAATAAVSATLAVSALWVGALLLAPTSLRRATLLPLGGTLVVPAVAAALLVGDALQATLTVGPAFSRPFGVHVEPVSTWVVPLLLVPTLVVIAAAACAALRLWQPVGRGVWGASLATAVVGGAIATLPAYDVPLALVVGAVLVAAGGVFATAERLTDPAADAARLTAPALTVAAAFLALPSDRLTTVVLVVTCAMVGYLATRPGLVGAVGMMALPLALTGLGWAGGSVVGAPEELRAVPVLVVLGALAIWRPRLELEASAALAGVVVSMASVAAARDLEVSLAVHLTVAGALVTASSLVHRSRRPLAWPGGLLLAAATWVRLHDLGVHVPEAYTLPTALALVAVGAWRLRHDDRTATLTSLAPGLALATVPSLVAMLDDPSSPRALLLGLACLALTVGGAAMRWSAPLVVGAVVGGLLVIRELAPYAAVVPTWLTLGASGVLLLVVGVTWESRMADVRRASGYVAALR